MAQIFTMKIMAAASCQTISIPPSKSSAVLTLPVPTCTHVQHHQKIHPSTKSQLLLLQRIPQICCGSIAFIKVKPLSWPQNMEPTFWETAFLVLIYPSYHCHIIFTCTFHVYMYTLVCHRIHAQAKELLEVSFLLPPCGFWGMNSGLLTWQQASFPSESFTGPQVVCFVF